MVKTQNIDVEKLAVARKKAGVKTGKLCETMGISRQAVWKKLNGKARFRMSEVFVLKSLLGLSDEEADAIFFPNNVHL